MADNNTSDNWLKRFWSSGEIGTFGTSVTLDTANMAQITGILVLGAVIIIAAWYAIKKYSV